MRKSSRTRIDTATKPARLTVSVAEGIGAASAFAFVASAIHTLGLSVTIGAPLISYFSVNDYLNQVVPWMTVFLAVAALISAIVFVPIRQITHPTAATARRLRVPPSSWSSGSLY